MLNTNGVRIANDPGLLKNWLLMLLNLKFIYSLIPLNLKFKDFRGKDLTDVRMKALEKLNELNLSTTWYCSSER
jgi:hypothetical protein